MAAASSASVDRLSLLAPFHSRVTGGEMETLPMKYDIPAGFPLSLPEEGRAVFEHSRERLPLYLAHLEYGLRLPLPTFVRRVCERLGVSPMQFAPNAIAIMMAFLVICHRVKVHPTLQLFSHLVSVKTTKKDAHFFFMTSGEKLVYFPESNKRWKEKFVWVFGANPILFCGAWPEVDKEALKPLPLTASECLDLEKVRSYGGSRNISNLFDNASIRAAGLSPILASDEDFGREAMLVATAGGPPRNPPAPASDAGAKSAAPVKRRRKNLTPAELAFIKGNRDKMAVSITQGPERKKRKLGKASSKEVADASAEEVGVPVLQPGQREGAMPTPGSPSAGSARGGSPAAGSVHGGSPAGSTGADHGAPIPEVHVVDLEGEDESPHASIGESTGELREAETTTEAATVESAPSLPTAGRLPLCLPFSSKVSDLGRDKWKELRGQLIGDLEEGFQPKGDPSEADRFVPEHSLWKDDSILLSGRAQTVATTQFSLPRDVAILKGMPSRGLCLSLESYQLRGALITSELVNRLDVAVTAHGQLAVELAKEISARGEVERRVGALEAEKAVADSKLARELAAKQSIISGLEADKAKQSATLDKLTGEVSNLEAEAKSHRLQMNIKTARLQLLEEELEAEKLARETAESDALSAQQSLQGAEGELRAMKAELEEAKKARDLALADAQSLRTRVDYLESEPGKNEVIEGYRQGPFGKVELALAIKAGFDFFKDRLSSSSVPPSDIPYPSRVDICLDVLQDLEARGGGIYLGSDEEDDDGEDEDEGGEGKDDEE